MYIYLKKIVLILIGLTILFYFYNLYNAILNNHKNVVYYILVIFTIIIGVLTFVLNLKFSKDSLSVFIDNNEVIDNIFFKNKKKFIWLELILLIITNLFYEIITIVYCYYSFQTVTKKINLPNYNFHIIFGLSLVTSVLLIIKIASDIVILNRRH